VLPHTRPWRRETPSPDFRILTAARLLSVPDARARYAEFSVKVLAKWEDFLLGRS
jgi:hypothetical protein